MQLLCAQPWGSGTRRHTEVQALSLQHRWVKGAIGSTLEAAGFAVTNLALCRETVVGHCGSVGFSCSADGVAGGRSMGFKR